jgi:hypothetical protein
VWEIPHQILWISHGLKAGLDAEWSTERQLRTEGRTQEMEAQIEGTIQPYMFTEAESQALWKLRARYQQEHGLWTAHVLAQLRFLRWLYRTHRLGVGHGASPPGGSIAEEVTSLDI